MPTATVTSKGQVTLPKSIRQAMRIKPGDRIDFVLDESGAVHLRPGTVDVRDLHGALHRPGRRPASLEEIERAIRRRGRP